MNKHFNPDITLWFGGFLFWIYPPNSMYVTHSLLQIQPSDYWTPALCAPSTPLLHRLNRNIPLIFCNYISWNTLFFCTLLSCSKVAKNCFKRNTTLLWLKVTTNFTPQPEIKLYCGVVFMTFKKKNKSSKKRFL